MFDADANFALPVVNVAHQGLWSTEHFRCVEDGSGSVGESIVLGVVVAAGAPCINVWLEGVPVCVATGGVGFADAGISVADPDRLLGADRVGELDEASVFFGHDEGLGHC